MQKREFVMLAHPYDPRKHCYNGWFVSEKLDGQRAIWLPFTRNDNVSAIPFANRERDTRDHVATGLWSRYGKPIFAPDWWLDTLPTSTILDGELYVGRGQFQTLSSYVRKHPAERSDAEWRNVQFKLFDAPDVEEFFRDGRIYTPHYKTIFDGILPRDVSIRGDFAKGLGIKRHGFKSFEDVYTFLQTLDLGDKSVAKPHLQTCLPFHTDKAKLRLDEIYGEVLEGGGEGVILRKYTQLWEPTRSHNLLKMKPTNDSEAKVIGFSLGIGKLEGLIGALVVSWCGRIFELSGFTDMERTLNNAKDWYSRFPVKTPIYPDPQKPNERDFSPFFKLGESITFTYRELTDKGLPKEARYHRKRPAYS